MFSPKQLNEVVDIVEASTNLPYVIDSHTGVKPYADMGHVLIDSTLAGCEGEVVVSKDALGKLGQILVEIARRQRVREEAAAEEAKKTK